MTIFKKNHGNLIFTIEYHSPKKQEGAAADRTNSMQEELVEFVVVVMGRQAGCCSSEFDVTASLQQLILLPSCPASYKQD